MPVDDTFFSCVTRDPFPDPACRGFAFHFKPGQTRDARLKRVAEVLKVQPVRLRSTSPRRSASSRRRRSATARSWPRSTAAWPGSKLLLTGNFFEGLAIEDCVLRSNAEWARAKAGR